MVVTVDAAASQLVVVVARDDSGSVDSVSVFEGVVDDYAPVDCVNLWGRGTERSELIVGVSFSQCSSLLTSNPLSLAILTSGLIVLLAIIT